MNKISPDVIIQNLNKEKKDLKDLQNEKKELFNEMTGNVVEMHSPELFESRNGLYPNCLYAAPLPNNVNSKILYKIYNNKQAIINKDLTSITNLCPSINFR